MWTHLISPFLFQFLFFPLQFKYSINSPKLKAKSKIQQLWCPLVVIAGGRRSLNSTSKFFFSCTFRIYLPFLRMEHESLIRLFLPTIQIHGFGGLLLLTFGFCFRWFGGFGSWVKMIMVKVHG